MILSGQSDTESAIRALRFGAFDYLTKPVEIERLDAALERCFDRLNLEREKEEAEHALAASEARFRAFFDNTPLSMSVKDLDGRYVMINRAYQEWLGRPAHELVGKRADEVYESIDHSGAFSALDQAVLETGNVAETEIRAAGQDGAVKDLATIKFPIRFDGDTISAIGTVAIDISTRKESERALAQSEELLRGFIDNSDATMTVKGPDGRYLMANRTFKRQRGSDDVIGQTFFEMGDRTDVENMTKVDRRVLETGEIVSGNDLVHYANGETWYRRYTKFPVYEAQGDFIGVGAIGSNIKEQVDAEARLRASEASLRAIIDNYPSLISLKDLDGRYLLVNEAFADRFNTTVDYAIGKTVKELQGPTPGDVVDDHDKEAIRLSTPVTRERSWEDDNGEKTTRAVTKFPAYDAEGELMGVGTISSNVTARRRAEEAVRKSEQQLRLIIDSLPISIGYFDEELRYVLANKTHAEWCASTPEALIGKSIKEVRETTYPGFERFVEQTLAGNVKSIETTADYPDGVTRDIQVTNVPDFVPDGRVRGLFGMAQDITARKRVERQHIEIEERFRAVIDNFPAAIVLKDVDGRYLMVNKTFREWLRIAPGDDCTGKTAYDFLPKETAEKVEAHERNVAAERVSQVEERHSTFPDGTTRRTWSHKFPIFGPGGECSAVGTVNLDVTEQRNLQAQLSQAQKMEAVGQLTGGVAHDFNNLLGVIVGNLDFLAEDLKDSPELYGMVEPAMKAALSGANLTRQLLAFSRKQPLMPQVIDLNEHVGDMTDMLRRTLGETVEIAIELDHEPRTTKVDAAQLEAALLNLAVNARDAMPDGGTLTIKTSKVVLDTNYTAQNPDVAPGDYTLLSVTDTGAGMTQQVMHQAFDPFFTTKEVGQGSGLGLSMVFGFTKQSGGHVEIDSTVDEGTTVHLLLPFVAQSTPPKPVEQTIDQDMPVAKGERVLVVEDDPEMLALAVTLLDGLGYHVIEATDGVNALQVLEQTSDIDLMLTDIVMPGG